MLCFKKKFLGARQFFLYFLEQRFFFEYFTGDYLAKEKRIHRFQTGDLVAANCPEG
jgi:hypothetical protein